MTGDSVGPGEQERHEVAASSVAPSSVEATRGYSKNGRKARWAFRLALCLLAVALLYQCAASMLYGPVPSMSLVPELPSDVEVVVNETEYSDGAGGNSGRVLVLRSPTRSPEEIVSLVSEGFDSNPEWIPGHDGQAMMPSGWHKDPCDGDSVTASTWVAEPGESIFVGQYEEVMVDERSAVVSIAILYNPFADCE